MADSFGTRFILVNDIRQPMKNVGGGPWIHLATIHYGFREFVCFTHAKSPARTYIEEIDIHSKEVFKKIEDDSLFRDLWNFLKDVGCLSIAGKEFKLVKHEV